MSTTDKQYKVDCFEYTLHQLYKPNNDFGRLKCNQLLFFLVSMEPELLNVFDNFYAQPYGHIDPDLLSTDLQLRHYQLTTTSLVKFSEPAARLIEQKEETLIKRAIENLQNSTKLLTLSAFDLIQLSRLWDSWKICFQEARRHNSYSMKIPNDFIALTTERYYSFDP